MIVTSKGKFLVSNTGFGELWKREDRCHMEGVVIGPDKMAGIYPEPSSQ
jgi:hypothetical protein